MTKSILYILAAVILFCFDSIGAATLGVICLLCAWISSEQYDENKILELENDLYERTY